MNFLKSIVTALVAKPLTWAVGRFEGAAAGQAVGNEAATVVESAVQAAAAAAVPAVSSALDSVAANLAGQAAAGTLTAASIRPAITNAVQSLNLGSVLETAIDGAVYTAPLPVEGATITVGQVYTAIEGVKTAVGALAK